MTIVDFVIVVGMVFVLGICGGAIIDLVNGLWESARDED